VKGYTLLSVKVQELAQELPGIKFGYIGNVGVDRNGPFDDRSWRVFVPVNRMLTYSDQVHFGSTAQMEEVSEAQWPGIEARIRTAYKERVKNG
jgi:hypothetical protein